MAAGRRSLFRIGDLKGLLYGVRVIQQGGAGRGHPGSESVSYKPFKRSRRLSIRLSTFAHSLSLISISLRRYRYRYKALDRSLIVTGTRWIIAIIRTSQACHTTGARAGGSIHLAPTFPRGGKVSPGAYSFFMRVCHLVSDEEHSCT